jgi:hypothetical protein
MTELNRLKSALGSKENLDEISNSVKSSYVKKAINKNIEDSGNLIKKGKDMSNKEYADANQKLDKRDKNIKKVISKLSKPVQESKDPKEYDYEGEMAKNDLHIITMHAERIAELLDDNTNMPEWVQSKLTLAKDYMQTISDYLCAEMREDMDEACWKGYVQLGMKEKGGKTVPNCIPTSKVPRKAKIKSEDVSESSDKTLVKKRMPKW